MTHFSPLSGQPDVPDSYHEVTIELSSAGGGSRVSLSQDNNATEQARQHSEKKWAMVLDSLEETTGEGLTAQPRFYPSSAGRPT